jgi:hypothetical protein
MDINKILRELRDEKKRVDRAIMRLEKRMADLGARPRRGRRSMSPEERLEVSRRILAYWAKRRSQLNTAS